MFNLAGEVIGVVSRIVSRSGGSDGLGFVVTSNMARRSLFAEPRVWSGLEGYLLTDEMARVFNVPLAHAGLLVQRVAHGSPAERLGLRGGDLPAVIAGEEMIVGGDIVLAVDGIALGEQDAYESIRRGRQWTFCTRRARQCRSTRCSRRSRGWRGDCGHRRSVGRWRIAALHAWRQPLLHRERHRLCGLGRVAMASPTSGRVARGRSVCQHSRVGTMEGGLQLLGAVSSNIAAGRPCLPGAACDAALSGKQVLANRRAHCRGARPAHRRPVSIRLRASRDRPHPPLAAIRGERAIRNRRAHIYVCSHTGRLIIRRNGIAWCSRARSSAPS